MTPLCTSCTNFWGSHNSSRFQAFFRIFVCMDWLGLDSVFSSADGKEKVTACSFPAFSSKHLWVLRRCEEPWWILEQGNTCERSHGRDVWVAETAGCCVGHQVSPPGGWQPLCAEVDQRPARVTVCGNSQDLCRPQSPPPLLAKTLSSAGGELLLPPALLAGNTSADSC